MKTFSTADVARLARGERVPPEVLLAVLADAEAMRELARQQLLCEFLTNTATDADAATFEEIVTVLRGEPVPEARQAAVERYFRVGESDGCVSGDGPTRLDGDTDLDGYSAHGR